jgi:Predicted integral membrane protein
MPSLWPERPQGRRWGGAAATLLLAVLLVWLAMRFGDLRWHDVDGLVREHGLILGAIAIVSIGGQSVVGAVKWRLLQRHFVQVDRREPSLAMLTFYSALTALAAQVIPTFLASGAVRGAVTRLHLEGSFLQGAGVTIYDQLFDVAILALCSVAALSLFLVGVDPPAIIAIVALALALLLLGATPLFRSVPPLSAALRFLPARVPGVGRIRQALEFAREKGLDTPDTTVRLLSLSILRYLFVALRSVAAVLLVATGLTWASASFGFAVVQGSALAALTPGNLGITEWGWAAIAELLHLPGGSVIVAILVLRIVNIPATLAVMLLSAMGLSGRRAAADLP